MEEAFIYSLMKYQVNMKKNQLIICIVLCLSCTITYSQSDSRDRIPDHNWDQGSVEALTLATIDDFAGEGVYEGDPDAIVMKVSDDINANAVVLWHDPSSGVYTAYSSIYRSLISIDSTRTIREVSGELERHLTVGSQLSSLKYFQMSRDRRVMRRFDRHRFVMFRTANNDYYFGYIGDPMADAWKVMFFREDADETPFFAVIDQNSKDIIKTNYPPLNNVHIVKMEVFTSVGRVNQLPY